MRGSDDVVLRALEISANGTIASAVTISAAKISQRGHSLGFIVASLAL